jgi:hypothetical protein
MLTLTPAVTCALAVASLLVAGTDGMRSVTVVLVMSVDVEVAGPGPCIKPRDGFLDLKTFLKMPMPMPMAGTLTGARSSIARAEIEVETRKSSWAV